MRKQYKVKTTAELTAEWYKKLKDGGFDDIERPDGRLKAWSTSDCFVYHSGLTFEAKQTYYQMAGKFLHHNKFLNEFEKHIWSMHSEGMSIRTIVKALKKERFKAYRRVVHETVQRLKKEMMDQCR